MTSRFYSKYKTQVDSRYKIFRSKVNMSYKEMVDWKKNKCSRAASIKIDEVINRVTRLLKKKKETWTLKDYEDSGKVISYISRASKIKDSTIPAKRKWGCLKGKNFYALRNWAYDREKEKRKRNPKYNKKFADDFYIDLLKKTIESKSRYNLINAIVYYNQGKCCTDCGKEYSLCECERCEDCKGRRCLCDLKSDSEFEYGQTIEDDFKIQDYAEQLANDTLNREQLRKLKNLLHKKSTRIY